MYRNVIAEESSDAARTRPPRATTTRGALLLLRHGRTRWNDESRFIGWADPSLSGRGAAEAARAGDVIASTGLTVSDVIASPATRVLETATIAMFGAHEHQLKWHVDWRLHERHFGLLQGLDADAAIDRYGKASVRRWKRDRDAIPPAIPADDMRHPRHDPRYVNVAPEHLPGAESIADHEARIMECWTGTIDPLLANGVNVLVVAHCHSLRALARLVTTGDVGETSTLFAATGSAVIASGTGALRELDIDETSTSER